MAKPKQPKPNLKKQKLTELAAFSAACREFAAECLPSLFAMANDKQAPLAVRMDAIELLMSYGFGKPRQTVQADVEWRGVVRVPEVLSDEAAWEAKWGPRLANREPVTLPAPASGNNMAPDDWPNPNGKDIFRRN